LGGDAIGLLLSIVALVFLFWFSIILPASMAASRRRNWFVWICISVVGTPLLAILLLIALGDAPERRG
jgi:protein-S-isoprenylcysteine O-methyltransferase Ste14